MILAVEVSGLEVLLLMIAWALLLLLLHIAKPAPAVDAVRSGNQDQNEIGDRSESYWTCTRW